MAEKSLVKIGPGLGKRTNIWRIVSKKVLAKSKDSSALTAQEQASLQQLTTGKDWMELVPEEWQNTYGEMFDTACCREPITTRTRDQIVRDVPRTFSLYIEHARYLRLEFGGDMSPYTEALQCVLEVACHQSYSCGYCQGMNFLAATFLLSEASCRSSFILFTYLLRQCHLEILYNPKCSSLLEYMMYYEKRLEVHNPTIYAHLQAEEFPPLCYTVEWFTTCFLVSSPGELSACVIDLLLSGFDDIMIRVGLALMDHLENVILQSNAEKLQLNFKRMLLLANCVDVMYRALLIPSENIDELSRLQTMKVNTEKMDPNSEWVDTMMKTSCTVHTTEPSSAMVGESSTNGESCTCRTEELASTDASNTSHTASSSGSSGNNGTKPPRHTNNSSEDPDFADWNHRSVSGSAVIGDASTRTSSVSASSSVSSSGRSSTKSKDFSPLSRTLSGIFSSSRKKT